MRFCTYCRNYKRVDDDWVETDDPAYCMYPDGYCNCESTRPEEPAQ